MTATTSSDESFDPRAAHDLLGKTTERAVGKLYPNDVTQYAVWAVAWPIAMIAYYLNLRGLLPGGFGIYGVVVLVAVVFTLTYAGSRLAGVGGRSRSTTITWTISWFVMFFSAGFIWGGVASLVGPEILAFLAPVMSTMAVGAVYLQGGALFSVARMTKLGWALVLLAGVASMFGPVNHLLVLGIGGGIIFGAGALMAARARRAWIGSQS